MSHCERLQTYFGKLLLHFELHGVLNAQQRAAELLSAVHLYTKRLNCTKGIILLTNMKIIILIIVCIFILNTLS